MTLVALHIGADRVDVVTDTWTYPYDGAPNAEVFGNTSKVHFLPHLDAIVTGVGNSVFSHEAKLALSVAATHKPTFDELVDFAPTACQHAWRAALLEVDGDEDVLKGCVVYLVGWSTSSGQFEGWAFDSAHDFGLEYVGGDFLVTPAPFDHPLGRREYRLLLDCWEAGGAPADAVEGLHRWYELDPRPVPTDAAGWVELAADVRERVKVLNPLVGGQLHHVVLTRDRVTSDRIHTYTETPEELAELLAAYPLTEEKP